MLKTGVLEIEAVLLMVLSLIADEAGVGQSREALAVVVAAEELDTSWAAEDEDGGKHRDVCDDEDEGTECRVGTVMESHWSVTSSVAM